MKRTTVTLTDAQERALATFGRPGPFRDTVRDWAAEHGIELGDSPAEAALVRVLIDAGIDRLRQTALDVGYAELADIYVHESIPAELDVLAADSLGAGDRHEA
jgi:hypothetical protein